MPNAQRLDLLRQLRETAGLSQEEAARCCGLTGRQSRLTLGAWERGAYAPDERRRAKLIGYLWDRLQLRRDPQQFAQVWALLVAEWGWEELREEEMRSLQLRLARSSPAPNGPTSSLTATPQATPFQVQPLIGHFVPRPDCLAQRRAALLADHPARRCALVGMGGAGKSTLAIHLAHELRSNFTDGVLWANPNISEPLDILQSWATAYHYDFSSIHDVASRAAALRGLLAPKRVLLVLDDVSALKQAETLLPGGEQCAVLLTTRDEECAVALGATVIPVTEFTPPESLLLLRQLLGNVRLAGEWSDGAALCDLLHHLPLAVEIAAQLLKVRTRRRVAELVGQLQQAQQRLDLRISNRAVRTSFAVSWAGLAPPLRSLFAAIAVFEGRFFSVEAAAHITNLPFIATQDRLDTLRALSLMSEVEAQRYRQHALLADFAAEQLGNERMTVLVALAEYYLRFCQTHTEQTAILEQEWGNMEAVLQQVGHQQLGALMMDLVDALSDFWLRSGRHAAAKAGCALAVAAAALAALPTRQAQFLIKQGYACAQLNEYTQATALLDAARQLARSIGAAILEADACGHLARIALEKSQYEQADELLTAAHQLRMASEDEAGLANVLHLRAILLYRQGDYRQAEQLSQQAIQIHERFGRTRELLESLRMVIDCALLAERNQLAEEYGLRALQLAERSGHRNEYAELSLNLATVYRRLQQFERAWAYAEQGSHLFERMGIQSFLSYAFYEQSKIRFLQQALAEALALAQRSLAIMLTLQDDFNRVYCLAHLGQIQSALGQEHEARQTWLTALTLAQSLHHPWLRVIQTALTAADNPSP